MPTPGVGEPVYSTAFIDAFLMICNSAARVANNNTRK